MCLQSSLERGQDGPDPLVLNEDMFLPKLINNTHLCPGLVSLLLQDAIDATNARGSDYLLDLGPRSTTHSRGELYDKVLKEITSIPGCAVTRIEPLPNPGYCAPVGAAQ